MSAFYGEAARRRVAAAVREVESRTAAEIVVAVRHQAGRYRHVDLGVGAAAAFAALLVLLFHPHSFGVRTMPLDLLVVFALGWAGSAHSPTLRRVLAGRRLRAAEVARSARAAFVELGVSRTRGRTGVLVYVAMLERAVELVGDVGVGADLREPTAAMQRALAADDLDGFLAGLGALAAPLAAALPRSADDVNELPDEPSAD